MNNTSEQRAEFTEQIGNRVDEVLREFQDLELTQMRRGEIKARAKLADVKKSFTIKRDAMKDELMRASKASAAAWADAKAGVESAWEELSTAIEQARDEFAEKDETEKEIQPA